jgi:phosphate-selective porin OprO and OprP
MGSRIAVVALGAILASASALPALAQEEKEWGYNRGFYFRTSQFELKISTRTQFRYTYTLFDDTSTSEDRGEFTLPRTRLRLDGFAYYPWLKYKVQYDFTGQTYTTATSLAIPTTTCTVLPCTVGGSTLSLSNRRGPDLRDLYFDITKNPWFSARLGQFKVPFGIQELTSSGDQEFVDRSIASEAFAPSRDQGAMLWGLSYEKRFGYEVGIFNGNARNRATNDNERYLWAVRVHWDPSGEYKLSESAVDHPDKPNWTVGAAYSNNATDALGDHTVETEEVFFGLKYKRLFVLADGYSRTSQTSSVDVDSEGSIVQVGYFFIPRKLELALRWSELDPDKDLDDNTQTETRLGFGYYVNKHDLKFQADYGTIENEASATDEDTDFFRAQLQIVF